MTTPFKKKKKKKTPMGIKAKPKGQYVTISGKKVFTTDPKTIFRDNLLNKTSKFFKDLLN
jgi:membrane-associated protease RseP (regulator of RpoE activity)